MKLLKKTASVKQLYNSVLHAIKTIASARDDITPELTKTFFENILRTSDDSPKLQVTKVKVKDGTEFGRHFCSEVHAVEVTAKVSKLFQENIIVTQLNNNSKLFCPNIRWHTFVYIIYTILKLNYLLLFKWSESFNKIPF